MKKLLKVALLAPIWVMFLLVGAVITGGASGGIASPVFLALAVAWVFVSAYSQVFVVIVIALIVSWLVFVNYVENSKA